jgi:hypothetical protein
MKPPEIESPNEIVINENKDFDAYGANVGRFSDLVTAHI